MNIKIEDCNAFQDERGELIQFLTNDFLISNEIPFGQIYFLTFEKKGVIRGNHYHNFSSEIFCLISGEVEMAFEDIESKEKLSISLTSDKKKYIKILVGKKIAHAIKSISNAALLVSFSSSQFSNRIQDKHTYVLLP